MCKGKSEKAEKVKVSVYKMNSFDHDEPILKKNDGRFVLFPIKHPKVSSYSSEFEFYFAKIINFKNRFGTCTRKPRHRFGQLKR